MRLLDIPELCLSTTLLTSDGVVVPLLSLVLSLVEGDDDFEKPRWVSLSSREWWSSAESREERPPTEATRRLVDEVALG